MSRSRSAGNWLFRLLAVACLAVASSACASTQVEPLVPASAVVPPRGAPGDSFVMFSDAQQFPVVNAFAKGGPHEREMVRDAIRKLAPNLILYGGDAGV